MMRVVAPSAAAAAANAAQWIASSLREAIAARDIATLALSGGSTPQLMLQRLAAETLPWQQLTVLQVDERIVPEGDPRRNLQLQRAVLVERGPLPAANLVAMPVAGPGSLESAALAYAARCARIDVLHLGLGEDGHTASLLPGDALLDEASALVGISGMHAGTRRMTLTFPAINAARRIVWLVVGEAKRARLQELTQGKGEVPALRVRRSGAVVFADAAAAGDDDVGDNDARDGDANQPDLAGPEGAGPEAAGDSCMAPETL